MKRWIAVAYSLLLLMMGMAGSAHAALSQPMPILDVRRLQVGARLEYNSWSARGGAPTIPFKREFGAGVVAAYALVPNVSLTWRTIYFVDNRLWNHALGVNLLLFDKGE
jgi:hypothetical protein